MRRLVAAIIIAVGITLAAFCSSRWVAATEKEVKKRCEEIILAPEKEKIDDFERFWEKRSYPLFLFVNRDSLESIGRAAAKMSSAGENNDIEEILESAEEIKFIINHIAEQESLSLQSFF